MKTTTISGFIIGAVLMISSRCTQLSIEAPKPVKINDTIPVPVITARLSDFTEYHDYYGVCAPVVRHTLVSTQGGRVDTVYVKPGDYVKTGQSLAGIDLVKTETLYEHAQLNERLAAQSLERTMRHQSDGNESVLDVDQARLAWLDAKARLLDAIQTRIQARCITPISGVVLSCLIDQYQVVPPGSSTVFVGQTGTLKLTVRVFESDLPLFKQSTILPVIFRHYAQRIWDGKVLRTAATAADSFRTFLSEIIINNKDNALVPGMSGCIRLPIKTYTNVVVLPAGAVRNKSEDPFVLIAHNNRVVCRPAYIVIKYK